MIVGRIIHVALGSNLRAWAQAAGIIIVGLFVGLLYTALHPAGASDSRAPFKQAWTAAPDAPAKNESP